MAKNFGNAFNSVMSGIGSGISNAAGAVGDIFTGGQPMSGSPDASGAMMAQGSADLPDVSGGAAPSMSAGSFATGAIGDTGDALSRALSAAGEPQGAPLGGGPIDLTRPSAPSISATGAPSAARSEGFQLFPRNESGDIDWGQFASTAIPAIQTGAALYRGLQTPGEVKNMERLAADAAARSSSMNANAMAAMHGQLPGGAQASLDQALAAARARIRSNYAALGMTGSSPEAQDLAYAELAATAQAFQIGQGMAQTGFNAAAGADNLAGQLYLNILNSETQRGTALGDALAEFAAGLVDPDAEPIGAEGS